MGLLRFVCGVVSGYSDPNTLHCYTWHQQYENRPCAATDVQAVSAVLAWHYQILLLARWVLCETQVTDRNGCIGRGYVLWNTAHSDLFTINRPMVHQQGVYSVMSKDSCMLKSINSGHHQTVCKEIREVIFITAVCSFRSQTVCFFSSVNGKVWDIRLQNAAVMLPFYCPLLTAWWWLCLVTETCSCLSFDIVNVCCVTGSFVGLL